MTSLSIMESSPLFGSSTTIDIEYFYVYVHNYYAEKSAKRKSFRLGDITEIRRGSADEGCSFKSTNILVGELIKSLKFQEKLLLFFNLRSA